MNQQETEQLKSIIIVVVIVCIWVVSGISAYITSIVYFGLSGSTWEKVVRLALAILAGPFYWIYFAINKNHIQ